MSWCLSVWPSYLKDEAAKKIRQTVSDSKVVDLWPLILLSSFYLTLSSIQRKFFPTPPACLHLISLVQANKENMAHVRQEQQTELQQNPTITTWKGFFFPSPFANVSFLPPLLLLVSLKAKPRRVWDSSQSWGMIRLLHPILLSSVSQCL